MESCNQPSKYRKLQTMTRFWKYAFPALYGLLMYITVRVLNDTLSHFQVWKRDWSITAIELLFVVAAGYVTLYAFEKLFQRFDKKLQNNVNFKTMLQELAWVVIITM